MVVVENLHRPTCQQKDLQPSDWLHSIAPERFSPEEIAHRRIQMYLTRARLAAGGITPEKLLAWKAKHGKLPRVISEEQPNDTAKRFLQGEPVANQNNG